MADVTHKDLLESLGNTAAGFTRNLANQAGNFACSLYKDYPWALTLGDTGNFSKGVWDELCRSRPSGLPSLPPSFSNGQCPNVEYRIFVTYKIRRKRDGAIIFTGNKNFRFYGKVVGLKASVNVNNVIILEYQYEYGQELVDSGGDASENEFVDYSITKVERPDGLPDNCGNLPTDFPHTPIPSNVRTTNINIDVHGGVSYSVPLTLRLDSNKYNITVDAGDLSLVFDFAGVTLSSNPVYNTVKNIDNRTQALTENVVNLAQSTNNFVANSVAYNTSFHLGNFQTAQDDGSSRPADEDAENNLAWVTLDIIRNPRNAKTQEGELAYDILYAGWFQFVSESYYFPREPIHFSKCIFKAPLGATSYAFTLYEGFEATVVEHRI